MGGVISIGAYGVKCIFDKELDINDEESALAAHFIDAIHESRPELEISVERRSQNYLSLCVGQFDFIRFKYSDRAKWITIYNYGLNEDDPRFAAQKNKRQSHWKASIKNLDDLEAFDDDALCACLKGVNQ